MAERKKKSGMIWRDGEIVEWVARCGCKRPGPDVLELHMIEPCDKHKAAFARKQRPTKPPTCLCGRVAEWLVVGTYGDRNDPRDQEHLSCEVCLMIGPRRAYRITVHPVRLIGPAHEDDLKLALPYPSHAEQEEFVQWWNNR